MEEDEELFKEVMFTIKNNKFVTSHDIRTLDLLGMPIMEIIEAIDSYDEFISSLYYHWENKKKRKEE